MLVYHSDAVRCGAVLWPQHERSNGLCAGRARGRAHTCAHSHLRKHATHTHTSFFHAINFVVYIALMMPIHTHTLTTCSLRCSTTLPSLSLTTWPRSRRVNQRRHTHTHVNNVRVFVCAARVAGGDSETAPFTAIDPVRLFRRAPAL